jgi:hypothetical protein
MHLNIKRYKFTYINQHKKEKEEISICFLGQGMWSA